MGITTRRWDFVEPHEEDGGLGGKTHTLFLPRGAWTHAVRFRQSFGQPLRRFGRAGSDIRTGLSYPSDPRIFMGRGARPDFPRSLARLMAT